jgi:hypothetical protein
MDEFQYFLKREYGHPMTLIHVMESEVNVDTGGQIATEISYSVPRGIYLPVDIERKVFTAAHNPSSAYPYGDHFDLSSAKILIDKKDLPVGYYCNNNDKIILEDTLQEFKIINITDLHHHEIHCIEMAVEEVQHSERVVI